MPFIFLIIYVYVFIYVFVIVHMWFCLFVFPVCCNYWFISLFVCFFLFIFLSSYTLFTMAADCSDYLSVTNYLLPCLLPAGQHPFRTPLCYMGKGEAGKIFKCEKKKLHTLFKGVFEHRRKNTQTHWI